MVVELNGFWKTGKATTEFLIIYLKGIKAKENKGKKINEGKNF